MKIEDLLGKKVYIGYCQTEYVYWLGRLGIELVDLINKADIVLTLAEVRDMLKTELAISLNEFEQLLDNDLIDRYSKVLIPSYQFISTYERGDMSIHTFRTIVRQQAIDDYSLCYLNRHLKGYKLVKRNEY